MKPARSSSRLTGAALGLALSLVALDAFARPKDDPAADEERARAALEDFTSEDSGLQEHLDEAAGYVVFPSVDKGGLVVGGARGWGVMFEKGVATGRVKLTQVSVGAQIGAQSFSELIILKDRAALNDFKRDRRALAAGLGVVGAGKDASQQLEYKDGIAVMTMAQGGVMAEASIGGQKFKFRPYPKRAPQT